MELYTGTCLHKGGDTFLISVGMFYSQKSSVKGFSNVTVLLLDLDQVQG